MRASLEEHVRAVDKPFRVARAGGLELFDRGVATCTPSKCCVSLAKFQRREGQRYVLDSHFGLWFESVSSRKLDE